MTKPLAPALRSKIVRYLLLQWRPDLIAAEVHCHVATVYRIQESLMIYGTPFRPQFRPKGGPRKNIACACACCFFCFLSFFGLEIPNMHTCIAEQ